MLFIGENLFGYMKYRVFIIEVICFLFVVLFLYAAITKLLEYDTFRTQIGQAPMLTFFAKWIVWIIPSIEIISSILLLIPRLRFFGLFSALVLMSMFTTYIIIILNFSPHVPCSCGGILEKLGWQEHLIFNIGFVGLAILGIKLYREDNFNSEHAAVVN